MNLWGTAQITYNGEVLATVDGCKLSLGGPIMETVSNGSGILGSRRKGFAPGIVEGSCYFEKATDALRFRGAQGVTIQFTTDNGETFVVRQAANVIESGGDVSEGTGKDAGTVRFKFSGMPAEAAT